jgi:hypothetical protein
MIGTYPVLGFAFICFATTAVLILVGLVFRRRGVLQGKWPSLAWVLLCGIPLLASIVHAYTQKMPAPAPGSAAAQLSAR